MTADTTTRPPGWLPDAEHDAVWRLRLAEVEAEETAKTATTAAAIVRGSSMTPTRVLGFESVAGMFAAAAAEGPRRWLLEGAWIAGTNMVLAAEAKVGKSFAMLDLAISVVAGVPWMDTYEVAAPGPVLCFWGEDDRQEVAARLRAICAAKGVDPMTLDGKLWMCFGVPNLSRADSLGQVRTQLAAHAAKVVILDPLYLSMGEKGDSKNLAAMGDLLYEFGALCREAGASAAILHHFNKTGEGTGASRLSGVGTVEWARTIATMTREGDQTVDERGRATVTLGLHFSGNSVQARTRLVERTIWSDDESDLNSPLHYEVREVEGATPGDAAAVSCARLERIVRHVGDNPGGSKSATATAVRGNRAAFHKAWEEAYAAGVLKGGRADGYRLRGTVDEALAACGVWVAAPPEGM